MMLFPLFAAVAFIVSPWFYQVSSNPVGDRSEAQYPPGHLGAVACETSLCTEIGIQALKDGGNAADALVATTFCVGVTG